ncbi:alpha/beta-hydrolase [Whalleya microplaca]|nr:alpha/beta-hydrolase [Whalleya microplaca]
MYELTNPQLIYEGPAPSASAVLARPRAPLFLVHDGGGTTFSYHCLDPIRRPLWGIQNVRLHDGGWWDGGIPEMARHYVELLAKAMPEGGDILLGGWSLGGLLSLEMAHQIATTAPRPKFRVLGMIWIDSVSPGRLAEVRGTGLPAESIVLTPEASADMKLRDKVDLNMTHARMMVQTWELPRWGKEKRGLEVPPTVLLRAKEFVGNPEKKFVDYPREFRLLGWDEYNEEHGRFIKEVVDVEGHHFSIFEMDNISEVTRKIDEAADLLDEPEF